MCLVCHACWRCRQLRRQSKVGRTLRISCAAVPPSISPAGAQGGTSSRRTGAALSFVSCIRLFDAAEFQLLRPFSRLLEHPHYPDQHNRPNRGNDDAPDCAVGPDPNKAE